MARSKAVNLMVFIHCLFIVCWVSVVSLLSGGLDCGPF